MTETTSAIALLLAAAIVALVVWALVPLLLRILRQWGIFDRPNERSSHSAATPKGGGLVVVPAVLGAWVILFLWTPDTATGIFPVIAGAALLAIVSWLDDLKDLPVAVRLLVQAGAVGLALWGMAPTLPLLNGVVPLAVEISVLALAWVWFINLFNFMDGIDGITAAETVSICLGLSLVALLQGWELADFGL
ncbi:MAG: glycosyl transferase, partial [Pseudomonadota bacterium]